MIPSTLRDIYTTSIDNYACRDAFSLFKVETVTYAELYQTPITWTKKSNWLSYSRIINWG